MIVSIQSLVRSIQQVNVMNYVEDNLTKNIITIENYANLCSTEFYLVLCDVRSNIRPLSSLFRAEHKLRNRLLLYNSILQ